MKRQRKKKTVATKTKPKAVTDQTIREIQLAYGRINASSVRRLRWLLNFSELPLEELSEGRSADLRWEVVVFGMNKNPASLQSRSEIWDELTSLILPPDNIDAGLKPQNAQALREETLLEGLTKGAHPAIVRQFQLFVRGGLDTLFKGEWWTYEDLPKKKSIAIPQLVGIEKADAALYRPPHAEEILELRAFELIDAEKKRLTICENPKCKKRFIAAKEGRTRFHSPTCSAYVRIAKSRGKQIYDEDVPPRGIQKHLSKQK